MALEVPAAVSHAIHSFPPHAASASRYPFTAFSRRFKGVATTAGLHFIAVHRGFYKHHLSGSVAIKRNSDKVPISNNTDNTDNRIRTAPESMLKPDACWEDWMYLPCTQQ